MQEKAKVVAKDGQFLWLDNSSFRSGCNACSEKVSCGTGLLSEFLQQKSSTLKLEANHFPKVQAGDEVLLTIPDGVLVKISLLLYGLPLFFLLLSALSFQQSEPLFQVLGASIGIYVGWLLAKKWSRVVELKTLNLIKLDTIPTV